MCPSLRKGSVLLITLWILAILSFLGIQYSLTARMDASIVREGGEGWRNYFHALETLRYAQALLLQSQGGGEETSLFPDGRRRELEFPWGKMEVYVEDEEGKVNINTASREEIYSLLLKLGVDERRAEVIADSLLDWRDPDSFPRLHGAEEGFYQGLPNPYRPANGPFKVLTEMLLVRGVSYSLFWEKPGLWRYFTLYSSGNYEESLSPFSFAREETLQAPPPSLYQGHVYRFVVALPGRDGKGKRLLVWWGRYSGGGFTEVDRLVW